MIFVCDLDGCIAALTERQQAFLKEKELMKNDGYKSVSQMSWKDDYYSDIPNQKPIEENVEFAKSLMYEIGTFIFITSRNQKYEKETRNWICKTFNWITYRPDLYMRGKKDFRPSHEVKRDNIKKIKSLYNISDFLVFEDDPKCRRMYKEEGCFLIYPPKTDYFTRFNDSL